MPQNRWPIAKEGLPFLIPSAILTLIFGWAGWTVLMVPVALLTLFIAYFFRNPMRKIPSLKNIILSPADGRVIDVVEYEEDRFFKTEGLKDLHLHVPL